MNPNGLNDAFSNHTMLIIGTNKKLIGLSIGKKRNELLESVVICEQKSVE
jgi:hypothetical protein